MMHQGKARFWKDAGNKFHRDGRPAAIWPRGTLAWFRHGKKHRVDGPAVIQSDGNVEYWIDGKPVPPFEGVYDE